MAESWVYNQSTLNIEGIRLVWSSPLLFVIHTYFLLRKDVTKNANIRRAFDISAKEKHCDHCHRQMARVCDKACIGVASYWIKQTDHTRAVGCRSRCERGKKRLKWTKPDVERGHDGKKRTDATLRAFEFSILNQQDVARSTSTQLRRAACGHRWKLAERVWLFLRTWSNAFEPDRFSSHHCKSHGRECWKWFCTWIDHTTTDYLSLFSSVQFSRWVCKHFLRSQVRWKCLQSQRWWRGITSSLAA